MPGTPSRVPAGKLRSTSRTRRGRVNASRHLGNKRVEAYTSGIFPAQPYRVQPLMRPLSHTPPTSPYHLSRRTVGSLGLLSNASDRVNTALETPVEAENEENHSPGFYERKRAATRSKHIAYRQAIKNAATAAATAAAAAAPARVTRSKKKAVLKAIKEAMARHPRGYGLPKPIGRSKNGSSTLSVLKARGIESTRVPGYDRKYQSYMLGD